MAYSTDLRKRVLDFITNGGSKVSAAERIFRVSRRTIYNWLEAEDPYACEKPGPKGPRHIDYDALQQHVADFPDFTLAERAQHFGASIHGIFYALSKLNITRKKKTTTYKEQCPVKRQEYLSTLQQETEQHRKKQVYIDESGFSETDFRRYAYAPKGVGVEAKVPSHRYKTTTLIAARFQGCFTAPVLFEGSCDAVAFNTWLSEMLCPLLDDSFHVVIMDNASFHKGSETEALIRSSGASLLFLPPYSPELNPIEKDFANIKRMRQYNAETSIDDIIKVYK